MSFREPTNDVLRNTEWDLIVLGRGYSSIVNCSTRACTGSLPQQTLLVGLPDPWRSYANHRMGQYPALLALPGYNGNYQFQTAPADEFLQSRHFGLANLLQLRLLLRFGIKQVTATVEDALEFAQNKWLVPLTRGGHTVTVSSRNVDICTGPGPGRVFHPGGGAVFGPWNTGIRDSFATRLLQELNDNTGERVFIAERFMRKKEIRGALLVVGEGPLAASAVEHALRCGATSVRWVGRHLEMAKISFPASTRYDDLIHNAASVRQQYSAFDSALEDGEIPDVSGLAIAMAPSDPRLTVVLGAVSGVQEDYATLTEYGGYPLQMLHVDSQSTVPRGENRTAQFNCLIISSSSENSESERRSAAHLLRSIPKYVAPDNPLIPISCDDMFNGLKVPSGSLRVLGAASRNRELLRKAGDFPADETSYRNWCDSLCEQARMPGYAMGITVGAATIATANGYYCDANPDMCANTARNLTAALLARRSASVHPFTTDDRSIAPFRGSIRSA